MSLYGMLFGQNPCQDVLLATLGLTKEDVGRFRDCFVSDGKIAVYTRNGGGNRECWHAEGDVGSERCKSHVEDRELPEWHHETAASGLTISTPTGKTVVETVHICEAPDSDACACPGCVIRHRLPKHPNYLSDQDDDFDSTYATVYFSFPEEYAAGLRALDSGEKWDPDARWLKMLEALKHATP